MVVRDWAAGANGGATIGDPGFGIGRKLRFEFAGRDRAVAMGSIDKYIFRTTLASFALVLVSLTGVIWITQALRGIDLMTSQGQTIITFLGVTSLVIPSLVLDHLADRPDDRDLAHPQQARDQL